MISKLQDATAVTPFELYEIINQRVQDLFCRLSCIALLQKYYLFYISSKINPRTGSISCITLERAWLKYVRTYSSLRAALQHISQLCGCDCKTACRFAVAACLQKIRKNVLHNVINQLNECEQCGVQQALV